MWSEESKRKRGNEETGRDRERGCNERERDEATQARGQFHSTKRTNGLGFSYFLSFEYNFTEEIEKISSFGVCSFFMPSPSRYYI